jgi:serine/threonine-protein kinase
MEQDPEGILTDRYRLIELIGSGGMADVWRGYDTVLDRPVAVKVATLAADPDHLGRLRAEARAYGRVASPHVAQVYDYGETEDQTPFLVMEYVSGTPMSHLAKQLPWRRAVGIAAEIADALRATHRAGLVHRDVKPDNVILTADGAKLVDFGISAPVGAPDADADGRLLGTPGYVAPERLVDVPVDAAADVYALGVLLYRMLSGRLPWPHQSTTEALRRSLFEDPEPIPAVTGLPDDVIRSCMACLAKDPHARPTSAELVAILSAAIGRDAGPIGAPVIDAAREPVEAPSGAGHATQASPIATPTRRLTGIVRSGLAASTVAAIRRRRPFVVATSAVALGALLMTAAWSASEHDVAAGSVADTPVSCLGRFDVTRDTGHALDAELTLTNVGTDVNDWLASVAFGGGKPALRPGAVVVRPTDGDPYPGAAAVKDGTVTVRSMAGSTGLAADRGVVVPVRLSYSGGKPSPTTVSLNGNTCQLSVSRPVMTQSPTAKPAAPPADDRPPAGNSGGKNHKHKGKGHGSGEDGHD